MKPTSALRIVFMGTPEFAVPSLNKLIENSYDVAAVVTVPDKAAGRGLKFRSSAVKDAAIQVRIPVLQPVNLKDKDFIAELKKIKADLQIVIAFRMLPKEVWEIPAMGTFNLHASLLPQYRGAAPINHAIINGETQTGLTTFFIDDKIDTGEILLQEIVNINEDETAGELHDKLMIKGSELVLKTVDFIASGKAVSTPQKESGILKKAPKIFKEDCRINWNLKLDTLYNFIRGLSPYPAAWTKLNAKQLKIFKVKKEIVHHTFENGKLIVEKDMLKIAVKGGFIIPLELQTEGKRRMVASDWLRGASLDPEKVFIK